MKLQIPFVLFERVAVSLTALALLASPGAAWAHRGAGHEHPAPATLTPAPLGGGLNQPVQIGPQSATDTPSLFANDAADVFALRAGDVYRASSDGAQCPGEFPPPCVLRVQAKTSLSARTMITDIAVRSTSIAVDEEHVYWGDYGFGFAGEQIMRVPLSANGLGRADAEPIAARQWPTATITDVAVDATYVYWSENKLTAPTAGHIFRRLKSGGPVQPLASYASPVKQLRADGAGGVLYLVSVFIIPNILTRSFVSGGVPTTTFSVYPLVDAFDLDDTFVYFASRAGSSTLTLKKMPRASFASDSASTLTTLADTSSSATSGVSGVSVDESNLFWVLWRSDGLNRTATLNRLSLSGGVTPDTLASTNLDIASGLKSDGIDVYWRNPNQNNSNFGALYRIRANALAAALGDLRVTGYEATQAVQTIANEIPLIARKPTVVRVYLAGEAGGGGAWTRVTGRLRSTDTGITYFPAMPNVTAQPGGSNRNRGDDSLSFVLGPLDTASGSRNYVVDVFQYGRADANAANNRLSFTLNFRTVPDVNLYGVIAARQFVSEAVPAIPAARWSDFELHVQFTQNAFPTARLQVLPVPGVGARPPSDSPFANEQAIEEWSSRTLARLPAGSKLNRMIDVPGASGFATGDGISRQENGRTAALKPGSTMAQEVAHTFGLWWHTFDPTPYPRPADSTVGSETGYKTTWFDIPALGFGPGPIAPTNSGTLNTPLTVDYMGYDVNNTNWTSPFTYCTLLAALSNNTVTCPASVEGGVAAGSMARTSGARLSADAVAGADAQQDYLFVLGEVNPAQSAATFMPFETIRRGADVTSYTPGTTFRLELRDGLGATTDYAFDINDSSHPGDPVRAHPFRLIVPRPSGLNRVRLYKGATLLAERLASTAAPTVSWLTPAPGAVLNGLQRVSWTSGDADGDALLHAIEYSPDGGANWYPLRVGLTGTQADVNADEIPGSASALLRIVASDGLHSASAERTISVPRKVPGVAITLNTPTVPSTDTLVSASGTAFDWEDGAIAASEQMTWTSSIDGVVGNGAWLARPLSPGLHTLTFSVRDSDGNTGSASVRVGVTVGLPTYLPLVRR